MKAIIQVALLLGFVALAGVYILIGALGPERDEREFSAAPWADHP